MRRPADEWGAVLDRLLTGDREAFLEINGLITRCLNRLRAYDFREDWDDLRQDVVLAVVRTAQAGKLRDSKAILAYLMTATRNRVLDRIKAHHRHREKATVPWEDAMERIPLEGDQAIEDANELRRAIENLPAQQRIIIDGVYRQGKTYAAVAADTGVPLGTMKRRLREGIAMLRQQFGRDSRTG